MDFGSEISSNKNKFELLRNEIDCVYEGISESN